MDEKPSASLISLSEGLYANVLKYSYKSYEIPSPKDALSKPRHIIMWGGIQVKLGEEKIGWTCEH